MYRNETNNSSNNSGKVARLVTGHWSLATVLVFSAILLVGQVQCQLESELESLETTPFMLDAGVPYRDMLTVGASQAVAQFASRYQSTEKEKILQNRINAQRTGSNKPQSPQFYSRTLEQIIGTESLDSIDFALSRRVRIPEDLRRDRILADRDEASITAERDRDQLISENSLDSNFSPTTTSRGLTRSSSLRSRQPVKPDPFSAGVGNYQNVVGHGLSYSTGYEPKPAYPTFASVTIAPTTAALAYSGFDYSSPGYTLSRRPYTSYPVSPRSISNLMPGRTTVDYNIEVTHGTSGGGSYSYSTFG